MQIMHATMIKWNNEEAKRIWTKNRVKDLLLRSRFGDAVAGPLLGRRGDHRRAWKKKSVGPTRNKKRRKKKREAGRRRGARRI